ncbi:MAG: MFS transporter [Pseudomonadota bacterium]
MVSAPLASNRVVPAPDTSRARTARLSDRAGFVLLASLAVSFLAGSSAPTPLYALYQARWGFSPIMTTLVFGIYALAVLASLLTVGRLSDHVGRRPVLVVATLLQAFTMLIFASANGASDLIAGRVIQGLSTGAALGAIGAGMIDLDRAKGTLANSVAPMIGTATGGMLSGLFVQYLPLPDKLVYGVLLIAFVVQALGVVLMREPAQTQAGALRSLKPQFSLPAELHAPMLVAAPLLVASWAFVGFYGSLGPALIGRLFGHGSVLLGGLTLFSMAGSGAVGVLMLRNQTGRQMTLIGAVALASGVASTLLALRLGSPTVFFLGTSMAGVGFGTGFQGAIRNLIPNAPVHARAGVLSVIFLISYLAMGVPAIVAGFRVVATHDLLGTARELGLVVGALALAALAGRLRR